MVVLIGPCGAGKQEFAYRHFNPNAVISSDACRLMLTEDSPEPEEPHLTRDAGDLLRWIAGKRLKRGRAAVIEAPNTSPENRRALVSLAKYYYVQPIAIVFDLPEEYCQQRNQARGKRRLPSEIIHEQAVQLHGTLSGLPKEGFRPIYYLSSPEEVAAVEVVRRRMKPDFQGQHGPFDLIGDVHGCGDELEALLEQLGYQRTPAEAQPWLTYPWTYRHPEKRKLVFVGDLVDRGPRILDVYQIAYNTCASGDGLCVPGNHDNKLLRKLKGHNVRLEHGLEQTLGEIEKLPDAICQPFQEALRGFFDSLPTHLVLDNHKLVVAHAGIKEYMIGREAPRVQDFTLYGETTGQADETGLPVRLQWAEKYHGWSRIVYGHTPVFEPLWLNHTINIDTGCIFGGRLSALRYPEMETVSVPALHRYAESKRPLEI